MQSTTSSEFTTFAYYSLIFQSFISINYPSTPQIPPLSSSLIIFSVVSYRMLVFSARFVSVFAQVLLLLPNLVLNDCLSSGGHIPSHTSTPWGWVIAMPRAISIQVAALQFLSSLCLLCLIYQSGFFGTPWSRVDVSPLLCRGGNVASSLLSSAECACLAWSPLCHCLS